MNKAVVIVGAGLAGCEAAWQLAKRKIPVVLFEMRPKVKTPAHQTGNPAELVCSNSFKSEDPANAHGLLKAEMEAANSLIVRCAKESRLPAGSALAVDRLVFSEKIKSELLETGQVEFQQEEITDIRKLQQTHEKIIIATGPLSSGKLTTALDELLGENQLFFYDAIAPVLHADSIDMTAAYKASRYDKGTPDYINCPMNDQEYENFIQNLLEAPKVPFKEFEQAKHFEGCLPIEVMAERGPETLAYGPMKPVGLEDPRTGKRWRAVLQLRQENQSGSLYNLVGCQTRMTWTAQKEVFQQIRGLENCEFARYGSMHRNTYINAPTQLNKNLELKAAPGVFLAGQITGVEGYTESSAMGLWAAMNIWADLTDNALPESDTRTMMGGLVNYLMRASAENFQPMNANFGLVAPWQGKKRLKKKDKRKILSELALNCWQEQLKELDW